MRNLTKVIRVLILVCAAAPLASRAQTFNILYSFNSGPYGQPWYSSPVQSFDGNFYGTTFSLGSVFRMSPAGKVRFYSLGDAEPYAGLIQTRRGLYGTAFFGGTGLNGAAGTVYRISTTGELTTLYNFCSLPNCADGYNPAQPLAQDAAGNFYGTTSYGGAYASAQCCVNGGTVFKMTPAGKLTTLYSFCALPNCADGDVPWAEPGLVFATDGNFYGTTSAGGLYGAGTVFKITPAGQLTTVYSFCSQPNCADGSNQYSGVIQGSDGNFYGTTFVGGLNSAGTLFQLTPSGALTVLYQFCSLADCADGSNPNGGLIQASDGNFYGTTAWGGLYGAGTLFEVTPQGALTVLHNFCTQSTCEDGQTYAGVVEGTDGVFYGETLGSFWSTGCIYSLNTQVTPFVETVPAFGKVNEKIEILGSNLTGATSVTFGGNVSAEFTVVSSSHIVATVPQGATTETISVVTPGQTLASNVAFRVTPQITSFHPERGPTGTEVTVSGDSLSQISAVTLDGLAVAFIVNSNTQVTLTVPTGALTGKIVVATPGGTATSSRSFVVTD